MPESGLCGHFLGHFVHFFRVLLEGRTTLKERVLKPVVAAW